MVVGAGHNGLIAAIRLADAGWDVTLLEAQPEVGGAVRSAEITPGYVTDLFSAFYPLAVASPVFADLDLADHGLALPNLGDIDRQTLAGAVSTGTHGTGLALG